MKEDFLTLKVKGITHCRRNRVQGLISIKQGIGQMSWTLIKGTGQQLVITMFMKEEYQTLSYNMKNVPDILEKYLANVRCPAWISAPESSQLTSMKSPKDTQKESLLSRLKNKI